MKLNQSLQKLNCGLSQELLSYRAMEAKWGKKLNDKMHWLEAVIRGTVTGFNLFDHFAVCVVVAFVGGGGFVCFCLVFGCVPVASAWCLELVRQCSKKKMFQSPPLCQNQYYFHGTFKVWRSWIDRPRIRLVRHRQKLVLTTWLCKNFAKTFSLICLGFGFVWFCFVCFCFYVFLNDLEFSRDFFQVFRTKTLASEGKLQKKQYRWNIDRGQ